MLIDAMVRRRRGVLREMHSTGVEPVTLGSEVNARCVLISPRREDGDGGDEGNLYLHRPVASSVRIAITVSPPQLPAPG
jgi:hypothetical protein